MNTEHEWIEERGPVTVVHLAAEYGSANVDALTDVQTLLLQRAEDADPPLLVLDLADTDYFGSELINVLLRCYARIKKRGGRFAICNIDPNLVTELQVAHLDSLWTICSTRDEAIQAIRRDKVGTRIRMLVVDDHDMVREGLRYAFAGTEIEVVESADGETALRLVLDEKVDIVLLDVDMPGLNGLEALSRIKQQKPDLPVLMHSCHDRVAYIDCCIALGAAGYIIKGPNKTKVIAAVRTALVGGNVWTPAQLRRAGTNRGAVIVEQYESVGRP